MPPEKVFVLGRKRCTFNGAIMFLSSALYTYIQYIIKLTYNNIWELYGETIYFFIYILRFFILAPLSKKDKSIPSCSLHPSLSCAVFLQLAIPSCLCYSLLHLSILLWSLLRHFLCKLARYIFSRCLLHHPYIAAVCHMYYTQPNLGTSPTLKALRNFGMLGLTPTWCF